MRPNKKKPIGSNKNFGPIQKLNVPDFQKISDQFEQMQNEVLEQPSKARKQMKQFSIHKVNKPAMGVRARHEGDGGADEVADVSKMGLEGIGSVGKDGYNGNEQSSLLSVEEQQALHPKEMKVVNPWIHEATHKEYLENIKGLPARHTNVIKKHKNVIREKTFLQDIDSTSVQKDQATQEALKILEKEYEIFNDPNLPSTKALTRYDTWEEDHTIEWWVAACQARPGVAHGLSPVFEGKDYVWKPVAVLDYDHKEHKFMVQVMMTGQQKLVTRLSLLFFDEDPELFRKRVNQCKERQAIVEAELRFTNLIDSIPSDQVSVLSKERRYNFLSKCVRESDKFDPDKVYATFKHLMRVVEEEYVRQMKKCIILKEMQDPSMHAKFQKLKIPIRLPKRTAPYFGVVRCLKYNFSQFLDDIVKQHWSSDNDLVGMTKIFTKKCIDFLEYKYMNTNKTILKLPRELKEMKKMQNSHHQSVSQNILIQWRDYLIGEIQDKLRKNHNFFEASQQSYEISPLKHIIARFEYILNTYLRQFVKNSIDDWVSFIKSFTVPNYDKGELWKVQNTPFLIIHLSFQMKDKKDKKKDAKTDKKKKKEDDQSAAAETNKIAFSPDLDKCASFLTFSLNMIIDSTNKVSNLEDDLMPFLQKEKSPNFALDANFSWIIEANAKLNEMMAENIVGPVALLEKYKQHEYILNVDRKQLIKNLFRGEEKASLEELRQEITHYDKASNEILNLSNDVVDFPLFRVMAQNMKQNLSHQADKIKQELMSAVYKYCIDCVINIEKSYEDMCTQIQTEPTNERELVMIREFIKDTPNKVDKLSFQLHEVYKHLLMLEDFSFKYVEKDIERFWSQKGWPMEVSALLTDGSYMIQNKEVIFMTKLEQEKESFLKSIDQFKENFEKIKKFHDIAASQEFSADSHNLRENLNTAFDKVKQFNDREVLFNQQTSEYPDLEELNALFAPFYDLTVTASDVEYQFKDWKSNPLHKQNAGQITSQVNQWHQQCFQLFKKLNDDYPETAAVAQELRIKIEGFMEHLPLIKCFSSEAILDEDWKEILESCKLAPNFEREEMTVDKMIQFELHKHIEEIEEITMKAEKKFSLNKKLKGMKEEMKQFVLALFPYKGKTFVLKGYDDINAKLDDQIVTTQAMKGSQFMKGKLAVETKNWETKLNNMSELIEEIAKCQRTWMYLEPIFASDDIHKQMPVEGSLFKDVDTLWKQTMEAIDNDPGIIDLSERENIKQQFEDANKKLDKIQKHLSEYLEEKRLVFPRFYFLANEDLLMILAQTKEPRAVQPHMDKCFEGIQKVMFSDNDEVYGMVSAEGEEVLFDGKVDVNEGDKKGNVEKWMLEIENVMKKSLKKICKDSMATYTTIKRTDWVRQYPGQIVLAANQIDWTMGVETAIKDYGSGGLESYEQLLQEQIEDIVRLVRSNLTIQERITLKALVVIDVHARDVVHDLIAKDVKSPFDFDWVAQLRYYWEENDTLKVKMVTAVTDYGYEYLGNSLRLVITPLTDRCYRTLLGAKNLNYGGAPEGPAGTGKTESVKDLAKAIAVQCVVFNCSDGLDFMAMAKFFKGLAASGAWCCFDEFNRIDLEVLSVIAQQILTIQNAIKNTKQRKFIFDDTELSINRACAVNITMNPGYAGRSELPDNLKALFRPCAMMVPDYKLIAEIELYSFGFSDASLLAVKVVASLRLSSEQLSSQDHYDFGMRALKTILTACGNLRRQLDSWEEKQIGLRALNDVNLAKFTSNDIPLFLGITSDLFPGVVLPKPDYGNLLDSIMNTCVERNIQPKQEFVEKIIQLYDTIMVRHGLMVVGKSLSGKSKVIQTLQRAMSAIKDDPLFVNVLTYYINPKSILQDQLYGTFNLDTQEWTDGVLAIKIRDAAESETPDRKWIIFDGPVDAVWIENMNTVLDDNKKLCLNSGQIIKLKPTMTMMFEVEDLSQASPATVSRCGMVYMEPQQLGHTVLITSYCNDLEKYLGKTAEAVRSLMNYVADTCIAFTNIQGKFPVPTDPNFLIASMLNVFDCFVRDWKQEDAKLPREMEEMCMNAVVFAHIWSIGIALDEHTRPKFDTFFQDLLAADDVNTKYRLDLAGFETRKILVKMGEYKSIFDIYFEREKINWISWLKTIPPYVVPRDVSYSQLIVPTIDSIRMNKMIYTLLMNDKHPMVCGHTGTGKSISIASELKSSFDNSDYAYISLSFSAQTSANQTQRIIDGKMEKRRKGVYGPPLGKKGVIFVDDLNMPQKEEYGAQPPIELLRQWMDYGGWYEIDTNEKEFRFLQQIKFVTAMGPPGGGRNSITARYVRHFNVIYIEPYSNDSLSYIFTNVMEWFFLKNNNPSFSKAIQGMRDSLVNNTIFIYKSISEKFRPTPAKSHYTYNLRDVSKVFQGIAKSSPKSIRSDVDMIKLWAHECLRVFQDRLINDQDRTKFDDLLKDVIKEKFKKEWNKIVEVEPLLFASFVPLIFPDDDMTKKPYSDLYCELYDRKKVKDATENSLVDYNHMHQSKKMNLVLFVSAIEHIVKIHRVITTEYGHGLLVGVGGSGRKSLTELATFIANYETFSIEMSKNYDFNAWRDDMKSKLFMGCGVDQKQTVFLFSDTQITNEAFVEDINNILNNGEIPNLYVLSEDQQLIIEGMREVNKNLPQYKNMSDQEIMEDFIIKAKTNLHLVLAMSPIGEDFKRRLRMFPSLVNCCAIDWFLPWPKEALQSVAEHFLNDVELDEREGIVSICVDMQERVSQLSIRYYQELKRFYYVTPTSYLVLIKTFKTLLNMKRKNINSIIQKYEKGIDQLANASEEVNRLQIVLNDLIPQLQEKQKQTAAMMQDIEKQKKHVAEKTKEVEAEENIAKAKKEEADTIQLDCQNELSRVMPIYNAAIKAVDELDKNDITEIKGFQKPPEAAKAVMKTMCILYEVAPEKVKGGNVKDVQYDYWEPAKKKLLTADLLKRCRQYNKDNISTEIIEKLKPIIATPEYQDDVLAKASKAAWGLAKWVRAMVQYDDAMKIVRPKQAQLKGAQEASKDAQRVWDEALDRLRAVEAQMKALMDEFEATKSEEEKLKTDKDSCERKYKRAGSLIEKLASENINWQSSLVVNKANRENLTGDILISSGIIAYLGVFVQSYRQDCIQTWVDMIRSFNIKSNTDINLQTILGNQVKIREWIIQKLPQDTFSIDNAIILENSERWPLMIDPQMQANIWIKQMELQHQIKVIKPSMDVKNLSRVVENAIQFGNPIMLEDANETFDPLLDPLLSRQIERKGNMMYIRVGDNLLEFSADQKFYITTKLSRPHYSPEVCVKVTMLNFMVTQEGLEDQMLSIVVRHEEPAKFLKRNECIVQKANNEKRVSELQDKILNQIASSSDNILEDDELVLTLDESKEQCKQIEQQLREMESTMKQIDNIREIFVPVALRVSRLFFVLADMMSVDPMYQYSLKFFCMVYERALDAADGKVDKNDRASRKAFFIRKFQRLLYKNVCRSLFEKDKLLFAFLMCLKIMDEAPGGLDNTEVRFLMTGATAIDFDRPNPAGQNGWLSDKAWASVLEVTRVLPQFTGFDKDFEKYLNDWERVYNSQIPQSKGKEPWPAQWNELSLLRRVIVLRILRPDKVIPAIQQMIKKEKELGKGYINPPPFDLAKSFSDSTNKTPVIFVLSPGADPMSELAKLAEQKRVKQRSLSLGQGQGQKAKEAILYAQEAQEWVVLQNCHLAPSFMPTLDGIIEDIQEDKSSSFRIWLTSMPSEKFPVSILQNGVKVTNEPPKGLKNNILRSYLAIEEQDFESCSKPIAYKRLLWGLCFFNALVLERRKYGPLGWNIPYEFSASDLRISQAQLQMFLNYYEEVPYDALQYMVAEANYGGRVTDPMDRRAINMILSDFYTPDVLKDNYKFSESGKYYIPPDGPLSGYIEFIKEQMPLNDLTEVFGLHDNADITSAINDTNMLLGTALSLMPRKAGGAGKSQEELLQESAKGILEKLPLNFDMEMACKKHPIRYEDSMNTVLQQELLRFNKLLSEVRTSLINIGKAIKGEVVMSLELEALGNSIFDNLVPQLWSKKAYPSLKPLASWVNDFIARLKFMQDWVDNGAPPTYWLSGFFFTQSFLTGVKQNYARKHVIAIDQIDFEFEVVSDPHRYDMEQPAEDGAFVYGLFIEGCRWNSESEFLAESFPKVLSSPMPHLWLKPAKTAEIDFKHSYQCPVYKTSRRAGTLSTTGHSTNFVIHIFLPMQKKHTQKHWVKRGVAMLTQLND